MQVDFVLNGTRRSFAAATGESLLHALRERFGIASVKDGCAPQGQCGCCLALIDGKPKTTCTIPAARAAGKNVVTVEGIDGAQRRQLAAAFVASGGLQCGFCIPGILLRTHHLLDRRPHPTRTEIAKALDVHLCRCTGYIRIIDAVQLAARARSGEVVLAPTRDGGVGASLGRYGGEALALGTRLFVGDLRRPHMLFGAVTLAAHPRALVKGIDVRRAQALPGVVRVATAADVPGDRWYGLVAADWPGFVAVGEETRCVGDVLAAVAAEDELTARRAAELVDIEYEVRPPLFTTDAALAPGAPRVNPKSAGNLLGHTVITRGDVDQALSTSAHVVSGIWQTQRVEHLYLEPEAALAEPRADGSLYLATAGQGIYDDRRQVAAFVGIDAADVFVELIPNGGAFGGKEDLSIQAHTALLALMSGRPVRLCLTREQSIRMHPKRHPIRMEYTVGCDAEGHLTAVRARMVGDTGAYASVGAEVLERAAAHACGPYRVDNVDVESLAVYTHNPPCGAMRGFGANQAAFAIEGVIDMLAERVGIDGFELRWRNALVAGDRFSTGQAIEHSVGLRQTLAAVKDSYDATKASGRAVGIACGVKSCGIGNGAVERGRVRLVVADDGTVALHNGFTEMGQGLLTVLIQIAVEVTGLPASVFRPVVDATFDLNCGQTTGSRATLLGGRAAIVAAEALARDLRTGASLTDLRGRVYKGEIRIDDTTAVGADARRIKTHTTFGFATQVCVLDDAGRVDRVVAAHDVGRAVNPDLCRAQLEGSIHMGLGYALTEELPCRDGVPVTFGLRELGVLRARDMPQVEVILIEDPEPAGPFGAKGVGEIGLVPTAGAVAGALAAFDGVRRRRLPMKDSPAAAAISVGRIRDRKDRDQWR